MFALDTAEMMTNPRLKIYWESLAENWASLAVSASLQEGLERELLIRED